MTTDRRTIRGSLYQALEPLVVANPAISPEQALTRLENDARLGNLLSYYSQPLAAVRATIREIHRESS